MLFRSHKGAIATGTGVAAGGLAASELAHRNRDSQDTTRQPYAADTTSRSNESGPYQVLPSGTASGVGSGVVGDSQHTSSMHGTPHGTTSHGTASHATSHGATRQPNAAETSSRSSESGPYQVLPSGTPSGVGAGVVGDSQHSPSTHGTQDSQYRDSARSGAAPTTAIRDNLTSAPYDDSVSSDQAGHSTGRAIATGAGVAGAAAASRGTRGSEQYDNNRTSNTQSGAPTSGSDWRSSLPPTVATERLGHSSAGPAATYNEQSAINPGASTHGTSREGAGRETSALSGTTHDKHSASHSGTTGQYNALETGTASGVAAGAVAAGAHSSHPPTHTDSHGVKGDIASLTQRNSQHETGRASSDSSGVYNVLPSGTPSGVNIEHKRQSKEFERGSQDVDRRY